MKYNILLVLAILCFCQTFYLFIINDDPFYFKISYKSATSVSYAFLLIMILLPPIYEELIFRGFLAFSRFSKYFKILFVCANIYFLINVVNYWSYVVTTIFLMLFFTINSLQRKDLKFQLFVVLSIVSFTIFHYDFYENFIYEQFIRTVGSRLGGALLLSWVCINFSLLYSILTHLGINFFLFSYFLTNNSSIELNGKLSSNPEIVYRISEHNFFNNTALLEQGTDEFVVKKASIKQIVSQLGKTNGDLLLKNNSLKYSINIKDNSGDLTKNEILKVLEEANLIKPID